MTRHSRDDAGRLGLALASPALLLDLRGAPDARRARSLGLPPLSGVGVRGPRRPPLDAVVRWSDPALPIAVVDARLPFLPMTLL